MLPVWATCLALALTAMWPALQRACLSNDGLLHTGSGCACQECEQPNLPLTSLSDCCSGCDADTGLAPKCCMCFEIEQRAQLLPRRVRVHLALVGLPVIATWLFELPAPTNWSPQVTLVDRSYFGVSPPLVLRL